MISTVADLPALWSDRAFYYSADHALMDKLVGIYNGELPDEFDDYFDPEMHVHVVNMIRLAWDDLATMAGKVFQIHVDPDNDSTTARKRAEKQEMVGYGYNRAGQVVGAISKELLQKVIAWWMVGCANAVLMVLPDYKKQTPYFTYRDPRTFYPPAGWSPYTQAAMQDALFAYQMSIAELKARYPKSRDELNQKLTRFVSGRGSRPDDSDWVWVGEYYTEDTWMVSTLNDNAVTLVRSDTGDKGHPGVQPAVPFGLYAPGGAKGRSLFADQISIQAAMARMFSQKLDFFDRTLYPLIFHTRLTGQTLRVGPYATNEFDPSDGFQPKVEVVAPAHQVDADQTMAFALGLSRMLNRNPESMQGAGEADSAKAIEALKSGVTTTIKDGLWPPMIEAEPRAYATAARMDIKLWGNVAKKATGSRKNSSFKVNYTPTVDLRDRVDDFQVRAGLGLAGYQGTLEILQLLGAEQISEETALEQRPDIPDADDEKRRIQGNRIQKLMFAELAQRAAAPPGTPGGLLPGALAEIWRRVLKGEDLYDVVDELEKAGRLTVPMPPPVPMGGPGAPGGGPVGPGTGPPASFLPLPTLEAMRGGPGSV